MKQATQQFSPNVVLSELLNTELYLDSFYHPNLGGVTRGGMTNHYPMTILSMHELGASETQIKNFKAHWPRHRALIDEHLGLSDEFELTPQNWFLHLGKSHKLKEFRRVFIQQIADLGSEEVLFDALQRMQNGLPMGLFHPLIKLSFAAKHGDKGLLADALAYMAIRYQDIYHSATLQVQALAQLKADKTSADFTLLQWQKIRTLMLQNKLTGRLPNLSYGGSIFVCEHLCSSSFVHELAQDSGVQLSAQHIKSQIQYITRAAVQLYLSEPSLTTLHAVTASQALAELTLRFVKNDQSSLVFANLWLRFWVWLTGLFIEKGCMLLAIEANGLVQNQSNPQDWSQLTKRALSSNEVHLIKMTYSCKWLFEQVSADPLYQFAVQSMLDNTNI